MNVYELTRWFHQLVIAASVHQKIKILLMLILAHLICRPLVVINASIILVHKHLQFTKVVFDQTSNFGNRLQQSQICVILHNVARKKQVNDIEI